MNVPFVNLQQDYQSYKSEIDSAITGVLERSNYILGDPVSQLESAFAHFCGAPYAIGVDSGFSALELILRAYGIGMGHTVITAANTFIATALAISSCGARPILVDMDPQTYNIDPDQIEAAIRPSTKAIIPVHLYGQPAEMDKIFAIAERYGLVVIEDACQAHGARYNGQRAGNLGHAAAFSFYPSKNLGAYGDGGMIVMQNEAMAERVRLLANLGQPRKYHHEIKGYNHRLDTMQAAIVGAKLPHLDHANASRRRAAQQYNELLADLPIALPTESECTESVYHLYVIQVDDRDGLQTHLAQANIASGIHYPIPIHLQPAYAELGYGRDDFPHTERSANRILSLPMFPGISESAVAYTADHIRSFFG